MREDFEPVDILLVDDRMDGLIAMEAVLSDLNVRIVKAPSGQRALALLPEYDFGVVLMDVQMPVMDGFQTAQMMKSDPRFRQIPIIFVTAISKDERFIYKGYTSGAVDYLLKPFDPQVLRQKVSVFVDLHRKNRELRDMNREQKEQEQQNRLTILAAYELESLERYRNLADAVPHIIWQTRIEGSLIYSNRKWPEYSGIEVEASMGVGWQAAFQEEDLQQLLKNWFAAMNSNSSFECDVQIRNHQGEYRWHIFRGIPELNSDGEMKGWLVTCSDIQDHKLLLQELQISKSAAEGANKAKTHFVANMSHEIRTPLSSILGYADLIRLNFPQEPELLKNIEIIRQNGELLLNIIDEVLDLSKVEAGQFNIDLGEVDLRQVLRDVKALIGFKVFDKGLTLDFNIVGEIPRRILCDATRLRQILLNVIGNAVKFTLKGGVKVNVECGAKLKITVEDSGIGISEDDAKKLFQPFVQSDNSNSRKFGGSGLGLALSRRLAEALGGYVWLESSRREQGSVFIIELGLKPMSSTDYFTDLAEPKLEILEGSRNDAEKPPADLSGIDILLAEDLPENQYLISHFLKRAGAKVDIAGNGLEAIERADRGDYSLILMDIQMPHLDGFEATRRLRSKGYKGPIIALTAHALNEEREACLRNGFTDHLSKPINHKLLVERVANYSQRGVH